ncbi:MAG: D-alanine--D-alanine ligase, partial [Gemmataceae bacterium]|nr:D-alanine--D-alanine ligase [Gemmataceae bacterium]
MRIGIACSIKPAAPPPPPLPDDWYEEWDSRETVEAIAATLQQLGHQVTILGDGPPLVQALLHDPPELVFNLAEGTGVSRSREARVPAVCELLGIPYTGSDPLALAVALDKSLTRTVMAAAGLHVPAGVTLPLPAQLPYNGDYAEFAAVLTEAGLSLPVVVKPVCEGSSKGITRQALVEHPEALGPAVVRVWQQYRQAALVEEYIAGEEVTAGIVGNDPPQLVGLMRIVPRHHPQRFLYSLEVKRNWHDQVDYEAPAQLPAAVYRAVEIDALTAFAALGCRDLARVDFRIRAGVPYFLEINPLPGLSPTSGDLCYLA